MTSSASKHSTLTHSNGLFQHEPCPTFGPVGPASCIGLLKRFNRSTSLPASGILMTNLCIGDSSFGERNGLLTSIFIFQLPLINIIWYNCFCKSFMKRVILFIAPLLIFFGILFFLDRKSGKGALQVTPVPKSNSIASSEIAQVKPGESYELIEDKDNWFKIKLTDGKVGWISSSYAVKQE